MYKIVSMGFNWISLSFLSEYDVCFAPKTQRTLYQYRELLWAYFLGTFNVCFFEKRVGGGQ
jgi:hypothetical protein